LDNNGLAFVSVDESI